MPKFPFTNYHELNLDWILKKVNALFDASEENARTIRTYDSRLTTAEHTATNAATAATSSQQLADAAAANADNALSVAGTADAKADSALTAATTAAGAAAGAMTTAQEARQIAGSAQSAAADAGAVANDASNAASAAQQTADTNAGNIADLQTAVKEIDNKADVIIDSASGGIASFADGANDMPIRSLVVNIEPLQAGSGEPSPTNVRPISGHTAAVISYSGADITNPETISITFPTAAGIVYGGTLDVINGILTVNKKMITYYGTENWKVITGSQQRYYIDKPHDCDMSTSRIGYITSHFSNLWSSGNNGEWGAFVVGGTTFKVLDSAAHFSGIAAFKTWLSDQNTNGTPLQIVYPLATAQTYQLAPHQINTLLGSNNIYSNVGSIADVQYPADTKLYIDGKIAELQALVLEN